MEDEYESLGQHSTPQTHMLAGAAAGIMEHCVMYPVDCVKTRMQVLMPDPRATYRNVADAFYKIIRYEGARITLRGINVTAYGAGPAHALYFASYEQVKKILSRSDSGNHLVHGVAGCCATLLHDAVMNPVDVIKQRMQLYNSPYATCRQCAMHVLRTEGVGAFYRSYSTQLTMNVPFQSLHFMLYELCQDFVNHDRAYNPTSHIISGALAGGAAAAATTPLDVCKTLLNTQQHCRETCAGDVASRHITGMGEAFRTVYRYRGIRGYFSGVSARVIYQMPSTAISWSVYEFFKFFLTHRDGGGGDGRGRTLSEEYGKSAMSKVPLQVSAASTASAVAK